MYHIAYHLEAQRRQRVIERKQDAIERLATKKVIIAESKLLCGFEAKKNCG